MGTLVACPMSTLYFAYNENKNLLPKFARWIMSCLRHIGDGIMAWKADSSEPSSHVAFERFITSANGCNHLTWTSLPLNIVTTFLDLLITLTQPYYVIITPRDNHFYLHQMIKWDSPHPPTFQRIAIKWLLLSTYEHSTCTSTRAQSAHFLFNKLTENNNNPLWLIN